MPSSLISAIVVNSDGTIRCLNYSPQYAALSSILGSGMISPLPLIERFESKRFTSFIGIQNVLPEISPLGSRLTGRDTFGSLVVVKEHEKPFSAAEVDEIIQFLYAEDYYGVA